MKSFVPIGFHWVQRHAGEFSKQATESVIDIGFNERAVSLGVFDQLGENMNEPADGPRML